MIELSRRSGIVIPREYENESWYHLVRAKLFRKQQQYNSPDFITNKYFSESEKFLTVPRFFPIHEYVDCKIINNSHVGEDIEIEHKITPRNEAQKATMDYMMNHDNGMIKLNPGMGKTVVSIYMIAERKKKTLVLVHRDSLDKQWRNRLFEFTDIDPKKVCILNSNKFEKQLAECSIIIATCQTILSLLKRKRMEYLIALNKANIGIFIGDEIHTTLGAPTFSNCSLHTPAAVTYGLSATPYRNDGNTDLLEYHVGDEFTVDSDEDTMSAEVTFILADFDIDTPRRNKYLNWEGNFQRSRYLNIMKNSKVFMDLVKALLLKLANDNRHLLFISERVDKMIVPLFDWLPTENKSKFIAGSALEELEKQISFSTPGKIRDGVDVPWKDSLLITSPVKNIEQLAGRITRTYPGHDKKTPIILDMVDIGCDNIKGSFWNRVDYYKSKDWKIKYMFINQFTYEKFNLNEEDAFTIVTGE
jgi:superfamily II DNA or RNA helicase